MRVAIVSDIHGNIRGLDACLDDLAAQGGADHLVAAGDLCMDGPKPRKVLERLQEAGAQCVRGNTDRMIAQGVDDLEEGRAIAWQRDRIGRTWTKWLGELPLQLRLGDELNTLLIAHANPKNDDEHVWPDAGEAQLERLFGDETARAFAFGHLHLPYARLWRDKLLTCVASAGLPKDGDPRAHYAILTNRDGGWEVKSRRVAFDVDKVAKDLRKSEMPDLAERLRVLRRHRYKNLTSIIP
ncbi:MAG: metallophosphoesterase family protein [Candidatus Velthaea sp.]